MTRELMRSHRVFGFVVARVDTPDGELAILETAPHKREVSPTHLLQPVTDQEAAFEATMSWARVNAAEKYPRFGHIFISDFFCESSVFEASMPDIME